MDCWFLVQVQRNKQTKTIHNRAKQSNNRSTGLYSGWEPLDVLALPQVEEDRSHLWYAIILKEISLGSNDDRMHYGRMEHASSYQ